MKNLLQPMFLLVAGVYITTAAPTPDNVESLLQRSANPRASQTKICQDLKIPLTVTSTNYVFGLPHFNNDLDVANWVVTATNRNPSIKKTVTPGTKNITATYTIGARFCQPAPGKKSNKVVLLATHGIGFDKSYWDPNLPAELKSETDKYSFVDHAVSRGYAVFSYDRLGVVSSSSRQTSGYTVQINNQLEIVKKLAKLVKAGGENILPGKFGNPKKTVLVGHSFGSALSYFAVSDEPDLVDGVVLTGFSTNISASNQGTALVAGFVPRIANLMEKKWNGLDSGYLATVDGNSSAVIFFQQPDYDPAIAEFAAANQAPFAVMELSTGREFSFNPPVTFKGAALIISGKYDWPFCAGDCDDVLANPGAQYFAGARPFKAIVYPKAGHGLNFHLNAKGSFKAITDFLYENGL
ncbi:Alpha/Beta hydrolase protein [Rhypophila decipiens]|uniref:Alpha/Beta hydrolase protein n=1 Tax=Rhypophila decipiens TaxID=261697 RepID=A0AAN7B916_9PEZI|nr:Alpha/Beta hydrolase protein [Rhypophila decipiens]